MAPNIPVASGMTETHCSVDLVVLVYRDMKISRRISRHLLCCKWHTVPLPLKIINI